MLPPRRIVSTSLPLILGFVAILFWFRADKPLPDFLSPQSLAQLQSFAAPLLSERLNSETFWQYLNDTRVPSYADAPRLSRGTLRSQGAKKSFKTNLRDDKKYLIAWQNGG